MDIFTHAIIGAIIAELALWKSDYQNRVRGRWIGAIIAASPDLGSAPGQFVFSWSFGDWPWVYDSRHWAGHADSYWLLGYWFTHSLFVAAMIGGAVYLKGWQMWPAIAWASHGIADVFTHTGVWSIWLLFPFPGQLEGFGDPWSGSPALWAACILAGGVVWYFISVVTSNWRANALEPSGL